MLIKSTDALIHFDYTRYFHYYRIHEVREAYFFIFFFNIDDAKRLIVLSTSDNWYRGKLQVSR